MRQTPLLIGRNAIEAAFSGALILLPSIALSLNCATDLESLRQQVQANPASEALWVDFGRCVIDQKRWDLGRETASAALAKNPTMVRPRVLYAVALIQEGKYRASIKELKKAMTQDRTYALTHYYLASAWLGLKQPEKALEPARQTTELSPKAAWSWHLLGSVYVALHRAEDAVAAAQKAVELEPQNTENQALLGLALEQKGSIPEARAAFQKAVSLNPSNPDARAGLERLQSASPKTDAHPR